MVWLVLILVLLLILFYHCRAPSFKKKILSKYKYKYKNEKEKSFIKLYEKYNQEGLVFKFEPVSYIRKIAKLNLKSLDINIPITSDVKNVEIWNIRQFSSESDFYNSYTESSFAKRANSAKYDLLVKLKAGEHIRLNLTEPIKKIFIHVY